MRIPSIASLVFLPLMASAQYPEQDCSGALLISSSTSTIHGYTGYGQVNEIAYRTNTTCLVDGEDNGVWLTFSVCDSGMLAFEIMPIKTGDDFDFSIYDCTGLICDQTLSSETHELRCNYSAIPGSTGCDAKDTIKSGAAGEGNQCAAISAYQGEKFLLIVSDHSGNAAGFNLVIYALAMDSCFFLYPTEESSPLPF